MIYVATFWCKAIENAYVKLWVLDIHWCEPTYVNYANMESFLETLVIMIFFISYSIKPNASYNQW